MDPIASSDLKTILHSKRANIYYLEHCRVLVNGGRVEYVTDAGKRSLYWNITSVHDTQQQAIDRARDIAINQQSEMFIQGRYGQIRERNSYGDDLFPRKG
ncbi:MAG: DUF2188 domain-containing protein [Acidovorax sp.]|uniref:DUF2188 domain-containing protein n=1 Tax=Acidovorax sp. TaxID=1872122 RepID=UPI0039E6BDE2